jgi:hypothetical protein
MGFTMRTLQPPLTTIEHSLFQPSDALIQRWTAGESLPPGLAESLAADTAACARRADLEQAATEPLAIDFDRPPPPLPPALRALIQRRVAARNATFDPPPQAGQIVRVDDVGGSGVGLSHPLAVLLAEPSADPQRWSGWLVAAEADYAGPWDVLLGPEDEPCDPLARLVQLWNPVQLEARHISRVLAQLSPARLAAVRALAADYATGTEPAAKAGASLRLCSRQVGTHRLLTGTPLSGDHDPRHYYQQLYARAAQTFLNVPKPLTQSAPNALERLAGLLQDWASGCGMLLTAMTPLAQPMGDAAPAPQALDYQLGDLARLRLRLDEGQALVHVRVESLVEQTLHVEYRESTETVLKAILNSQQPVVELAVDPHCSSELLLTDSTGQPLARLPLGRNDGG